MIVRIGLLLLHNIIGNARGKGSRWCWASPRRVMRELFPGEPTLHVSACAFRLLASDATASCSHHSSGEKFEFLTLLEPHKAYQGSVAMLRRLDPEKEPRKFRHAANTVRIVAL